MMSEWTTHTLNDVCLKIYSGGTPSTKHSEYWNGDINWLSSGETSNKYIYETDRKISKLGVSKSSTQLAHKGDTVVASAGQGYTRGQASYLMIDTYVNQSVIVFHANTELIDNKYLFYNLGNRYEELRQLSDGTSTRGGLSGWIVKRMEINLPPIDEQKQIVGILSAIDDKIELNTAINENLHQLIAAYYAEIFKKCEHTAKISDYADRVFSGGTPTTSNESYWSGEFKWLSSGETSQKYIVDTEKTITQAGVDNSSTRLAKKYDTVIASAGQGHTRGQTSMLLTDTYINQSIIVVESERIYMPFIYWNICGRYEELRVISNSNSIRGSLTTKMISAFTAPKADITQISRFSELAWAAIHEIEKNCNEIARLAALRDTLLPKLMNGEIDVSAVQV